MRPDVIFPIYLEAALSKIALNWWMVVLISLLWWLRTWVPSFGPTSVADLRTRLADLSLCGDLHAAFGQKRRSLGRQLPLRGRERRGCSQAGDTDLRW
ncbi:hypothetical protein Zmor_006413 [Zophobas morio]|uniref:Uncharacterized protein n=1 Tax=Zophobas morio TaxID=2755281 RepID=A0AA38MMS8_9CUCU|nr:hypothetical protein Zmor_006413 [Zophobas morio]